MKSDTRWKSLPHAQAHFPPLTGEEALRFVNLLTRVVDAIWRTHGDAMADHLGCCNPEAALSTMPDNKPYFVSHHNDDNIF